MQFFDPSFSFIKLIILALLCFTILYSEDHNYYKQNWGVVVLIFVLILLA